jgi:uncharacterized membrane protein YbaN (DUF454 family)
MIVLGALSLALGAIGIFLPLLPTAPFVLLAAFFFSRGSKRLHLWLREHPRFGVYVRDWEAEQVIPPVGKYASTLMMIPSVGWAIATRDIPPVLSFLMVATVAAVLWFIWTRPSRRSLAAAMRPEDSGRRDHFALRRPSPTQARSAETTANGPRRAGPRDP